MKSELSFMVSAVKEAYDRGEEDEALEPIVAFDRAGQPVGRIQHGDSVIFYDIRGEREVEITESLVKKNFSHFPIAKELDLNYVTMIEYSSSLEVKVAFPPERRIANTFVEVVTQAGLHVLKIAESEKAVHVGFFLNGKTETIFSGEERTVVPSPQGVDNYALTPEMSAGQVSDEIFHNLENPAYDVIIANLSNVDVVGHIEDRQAVLKAIESVDNELGRIADFCRDKGIVLVVTADHGTVEEWFYPDGKINTGHTKNLVPFILSDEALCTQKKIKFKERGELADVAPTLLKLIGINQPEEMSGESLIHGELEAFHKNRRLLLLILDGWGKREEEYGNLIVEAKTPHFDRLWSGFPHALLKASGEAVGMPAGTVGNSEAGHLHIGAGRRILLDRVRIDKAIEDGQFYQNEAFLWAIEKAKNAGKSLHLLGIVSHYSSHGTIDHLFALLRLAKGKGLKHVYIHALIGRRGEKPESGAVYIGKVEDKCRSIAVGSVVTVMG
ncbi:MAG: alkaline phosphatase family protein, partial [Candidatus Aminicenantes bacterium]|nr:alkaline phosphatase family protein [Candidatus Aminicenantes bacterium]